MPRRLALSSLLALALLLAFGLRAYTVRRVSIAAVSPNLEVVSVYSMSSVAMRQLTDAALSDALVQAALRGEGQAIFIAHVLPHDYGMIGMFAAEASDLCGLGSQLNTHTSNCQTDPVVVTVVDRRRDHFM